jgi:GxxExxY protein
MDVNDLTYAVIGFAYKSHNTLGAGFIESVYENSLKIELNKIGIFVPKKVELDVFYEGQLVGHFIPDIWIRDTLIVEVKAVQGLSKVHEVQLVNYLTATNIDIGLLINFGPSVEVKRNYRNFKPKQV